MPKDKSKFVNSTGLAGLAAFDENSDKSSDENSGLPFWIQPKYVESQIKYSWNNYPRSWLYWILGIAAAGGTIYGYKKMTD